MLRFALFDLDDTLYNAQCGLWAAIGERIDRYLVQRMGFSPDTVVALRRRYLDGYGTTLNGLRAEHGIDVADYLAFVHDLPLERYLQADAALDQMLARLPLAKIIFTNADEPHAQRVLARLGIAHHFARIVDIRALDFANKPDPRAYERVLALLRARAGECVFVDDAPRNLWPARAAGMLTILVNSTPPRTVDGIDYQVASVLDVEKILAPLLPTPGRASASSAQPAAPSPVGQ